MISLYLTVLGDMDELVDAEWSEAACFEGFAAN